MPTTFVNTRDFPDARRSLRERTRIDALSCIHLAQRLVAEALLKAQAPERLTRLAKADVVETLLAKAAVVVCDDPQFEQLTTESHREAFLEVHLQMALYGWLGCHLQNAKEQLTWERARRDFQGDYR